ncbi:hypothetical protein TVAG_423240 [Trichomonas vaginalis G3]|uniref:Uncharacterized protein n=1 Tax=Trichomonas vaginalis (strain ATCC PRA-98 / G3) TaxID=412133 RepID=A2DTG2_TRIV3|nr:hypothetical protein TVAGG3_0593440 [Trichomonas vaginalis G3]EAY16271.1 hypothetical protein TVAG_423240 [Trichomonas vaginalis G3]KAI5523421.1 hypothetical protein TVAGG3_0593440 [Trichomonas vaginalis G3]|eukprot:XP_001328494.1 hypothetical protein [Trichomonas vaginalis G3]
MPGYNPQRASGNYMSGGDKGKDLANKIFIQPISGPNKTKIQQNAEAYQNDAQTARQSIQIDPDPIIKRIDEPIRNRLQAQLPIQELNFVSVQAEATIEYMQQDIDQIDTRVISTSKKVGEISQKIRLLQGKAVSLTQTTEAINAKLTVLDDWLDGLEGVGGNYKMRLIEFIVKMFTFISSLFLLLWNSLKAMNPMKWRFRKDTKIETKQEKDQDSTTDDMTEPGS